MDTSLSSYKPPKAKWYTGRISDEQHYLHEVIQLTPIDELEQASNASVALLGYACHLGVKLNQGRIGAAKGPKAFRLQFGKQANHLQEGKTITDVGNIRCRGNSDLIVYQQDLADSVSHLLKLNYFPIVIGGGHDIAFGHYKGIHKFIQQQNSAKTIGIINFDAHLDLRQPNLDANSGTPFYEIAEQFGQENFHYCAIGIRPESNHKGLITTAQDLGVKIIEQKQCKLANLQAVKQQLNSFIEKLDAIYLTIDLDGFSSAIAPGVSAPHPIGLSYSFVKEMVQFIQKSNKLISVDFAELNPKYDIENSTAKLAASLSSEIIQNI